MAARAAEAKAGVRQLSSHAAKLVLIAQTPSLLGRTRCCVRPACTGARGRRLTRGGALRPSQAARRRPASGEASSRNSASPGGGARIAWVGHHQGKVL
jgi:hypothetical protein